MSSDEEPINIDLEISDNEIGHDDNVVLADNEEVEGAEEKTVEVERDADDEGGNEDGGNKVPVKPKRVVRNPQPKLNAETLKGPRGLAAIESYFDRVKFRGKGYEDRDLNTIMKSYEYWCHRLFPKYPFDTCIETLEKLGHKKPVQTHIKRIRFDLLVEEKPIIDSSDEENNVDGFVDIQEDQIKQQNNMQFDHLMTTAVPQSSQPATLTDEQLERIRLNKEKAERLRQERLKKIQDKAQANLEVSSQVAGTSGLDHNTYDDDQSDTMSQEVLGSAFDDVEFNHESNLKGKSLVKGNTVKKSSKKIVDKENGDAGYFDLKKTRKNKLFDSEDEDDQENGNESVNQDALVRSKSKYNKSDQENEDFNKQSKIIDESDQDMGETSQSNSDLTDTAQGVNNPIQQRLAADSMDINEDEESGIKDNDKNLFNLEKMPLEDNGCLQINEEPQKNGYTKQKSPDKLKQVGEDISASDQYTEEAGREISNVTTSLEKDDCERETQIIESMEIVEENQDSVFKSTDLIMDKYNVQNSLLSENKENSSTDNYS